METGRVIHGRYLLQRLIKQTAFCCVYQGMDQRLQRAVAVKAVFQPQITAYRTALKMTANFSHQHILGLYDLVIEPESLYIVQEYVDGDTFEALRQARLSPFEIAEAGWQMCLALMYAGSSSRRVCHGDLTPGALLRDRHGAIKLNNFALPPDSAYFEKWSLMGGEGIALLETTLVPGQQSEDRKADDTRAVGLLLYQLLTGVQEPQPDGRLRFARGTPPELCETLARALVRKHPQHIKTPEELYAQFKKLAVALEPAPPAPALTPVVEESPARPFAPVAAGKVSLPLPARGYESGGRPLSSYSSKLPKLEAVPTEATVADLPFTPAQQARSVTSSTLPPRPIQPSSNQPSPALIILLIGLIAFGLFFAVGYFLGHALIH